MSENLTPRAKVRHRVENLFLLALLRAVGRLPWAIRLATLGWVVRRVIGPLAGWTRRADSNLRMVWPDMGRDARQKIVQRAMDNIGRSFAEFYSPQELRRRVAGQSFEGDGAAPLMEALAKRRPVVLVSGHYGNYEAPKCALAERGFPVAMIYRPASNPLFNRHYWATISGLGGKVFAQGTETAAFFDHAKTGHPVALLFDVRTDKGLDLPFLGRDARTAPSAARLALDEQALLIPFWGIRQPDGISFRLVFEAPIAHSTIEQMMAELTARLEARIAQDPGQWLWSHRRWSD